MGKTLDTSCCPCTHRQKRLHSQPATVTSGILLCPPLCEGMTGLKILSSFPTELNIEDHIMVVNHSESMMLELIASSQSISISVT